MKNKKNKNLEKISYLSGALVGDGCYHREKNSKSPRVLFGSSDKEFTLLIKNIISSNFGLDLNIRTNKLSKKNKNWRDHHIITSRKLYSSLSEYLPSLKEIPIFIKKSNNNIKAMFLNGFFDAEGGICISTIKSRNALDRRIYCHSSDINILKEIKEYLRELGISSFIQKGKGAYALNIWGYGNFMKFKKYIGFNINRKHEKLDEAINSYKYIHKRWKEI